MQVYTFSKPLELSKVSVMNKNIFRKKMDNFLYDVCFIHCLEIASFMYVKSMGFFNSFKLHIVLGSVHLFSLWLASKKTQNILRIDMNPFIENGNFLSNNISSFGKLV